MLIQEKSFGKSIFPAIPTSKSPVASRTGLFLRLSVMVKTFGSSTAVAQLAVSLWKEIKYGYVSTPLVTVTPTRQFEPVMVDDVILHLEVHDKKNGSKITKWAAPGKKAKPTIPGGVPLKDIWTYIHALDKNTDKFSGEKMPELRCTELQLSVN